jgi:hypothetical protein
LLFFLLLKKDIIVRKKEVEKNHFNIRAKERKEKKKKERERERE